jgi:hypothetical protein
MITGLTQIFIWILFTLVIGEYAWKGYVKYKDTKGKVLTQPEVDEPIVPDNGGYQLRSSGAKSGKNLEENK